MDSQRNATCHCNLYLRNSQWMARSKVYQSGSNSAQYYLHCVLFFSQDFEFYRILPQGDNVPSSAAQVVPVPAPQVQAPPPPVPAQQAPAPVFEASPQPAAVTPPAPQRNERIYLQVGSFENPSEADNLKARLALSGIQASAQRTQLPDGRIVHRVRVGPFAKPEDMNPMRARLSDAGFNASVSRNQ